MSPALWWWNGALVDEDAIRIDPSDRGLRYGDGLYETVRVHRGRSFLLSQHLERMAAGLELIGIDLEPTIAFPTAALRELIAAQVGTGEGRLRLQVTRGPFEDPGALRPTVLAQVEPLPPDAPMSVLGPVRLATVDTLARRAGAWSSLKSLSYLSYGLAARDARRRGADDALLCVEGQVLEASAANVFIVQGERLATPPVSAGILAGVTRELVLTLARESELVTIEEPIHVDTLHNASEIFLTGSVRGVRPVACVDSITPRESRLGPVTETLRVAYAEFADRICSQPEIP